MGALIDEKKPVMLQAKFRHRLGNHIDAHVISLSLIPFLDTFHWVLQQDEPESDQEGYEM